MSCCHDSILLKYYGSRWHSRSICSKLTMFLVNEIVKILNIVGKNATIFAKKSESFCSAKAVLIFLAKNISTLNLSRQEHLTNS